MPFLPNRSRHSALAPDLLTIVLFLSACSLLLTGSVAERYPAVESRSRAEGYPITISARSSSATDKDYVMREVRRVEGVAAVAATISGQFASTDLRGLNWTTVTFSGTDSEWPARCYPPPSPGVGLVQGRLPEPDSMDECVLGFELAQQVGLRVGNSIEIQGHPFTVVGIWGPSAIRRGNFAQVSYDAAVYILGASPNRYDTITAWTAPGYSPEAVAKRIWSEIDGLNVVSPDTEWSGVRRAVLVTSALTALVAVLILLVATPVTFAVAHATAAQGDGLSETLVLFGSIGAVAGLVLGWMATFAINNWVRNNYALTPCVVTPRLVIGSLAVTALALTIGLAWAKWRWERAGWPVALVAVVASVVLVVAAQFVAGSWGESLQATLSIAQNLGRDRVLLQALRGSRRLTHELGRLPAVSGIVLEAYSGPVNEDELGWQSLRPASGVLYGLQTSTGYPGLSVLYPVHLAEGRTLSPGAEWEAVVGYDLAQQRGLRIGETLTIRERDFVVVGIWARVPYGFPHDANFRVDIPLTTFRQIMGDPYAVDKITLFVPPVTRAEDRAEYLNRVAALVTEATVQPVDSLLLEAVAGFPAAQSVVRETLDVAILRLRVVYNTVRWGIGFLGLALSGLGLAAALALTVASQREGIRLKKLVGATEADIFAEYLGWAALLGGIAGLCGAFLGWGAASWVNSSYILVQQDIPVLVSTPRLFITSVLLGLFTGLAGGFYPALHAAREFPGEYTAPISASEPSTLTGWEASP
ncbi:MAG: ABC transporter permease [Chloroflexi bacterium]|nr:ABC transporter permease [Chloroflexota bacterium]